MSDTSLPVVRSSTSGLPETLSVEDGEYLHQPQSLQLPNSSNWANRSKNNSDKRTRQDENDIDDEYLIFCDYGEILETHFSYALDFAN
ncbi:hypothetical protein DPMN_170752 [Dreissena polymorpha]|uniref:Uncharacterized protein n=1 Tax=Dreissena polymorpha TaxID=45954 RepID=A0A9D4DZZ3_DREPO|nr:hypothetical protein DPMN_170752 [Dreissena polymorpha]